MVFFNKQLYQACLNRCKNSVTCLPSITSTTEAAISSTPATSDRLIGSLNTKMPTATAVTGSITPKIEVRVEPIRWIARIRVRFDTTAVTTASRVASSSSH